MIPQRVREETRKKCFDEDTLDKGVEASFQKKLVSFKVTDFRPSSLVTRK